MKTLYGHLDVLYSTIILICPFYSHSEFRFYHRYFVISWWGCSALVKVIELFASCFPRNQAPLHFALGLEEKIRHCNQLRLRMKGTLFPGDQEGNNGRLMGSVYINIPMGKCLEKGNWPRKLYFLIENMMMNQGILADKTKCWHITFHVDFRCFSHLQDKKKWLQLTTFLASKNWQKTPPQLWLR